MDKSIDKMTKKYQSLETVSVILNNPNYKYLFSGVILCYFLNKIVNSNYTFETMIDANSKIFKFNITPASGSR